MIVHTDRKPDYYDWRFYDWRLSHEEKVNGVLGKLGELVLKVDVLSIETCMTTTITYKG